MYSCCSYYYMLPLEDDLGLKEEDMEPLRVVVPIEKETMQRETHMTSSMDDSPLSNVTETTTGTVVTTMDRDTLPTNTNRKGRHPIILVVTTTTTTLGHSWINFLVI